MDDPGQVGLFAGLFDRFSEVVGDEASRASFHYAGFQEGRRLARARPGDLDTCVSYFSRILGQDLKATQEDGLVKVEVATGPFKDTSNPVIDGILTGLLEGMLREALRKPYRRTESPNGSLHFEVKTNG